MNEISNNGSRSFNSTNANVQANTLYMMPHREQVLIDAFNSYIQIGIGSILFICGVTFNCLSLLYFYVSRSFRHTTFRLYFSIIAILDTIRLFEFLVFVLFDKGYLNVTLTLCRSIFFTIMFTGQASIWLTVALAVEKCISIWFPIKGRLFFTMAISKVSLISILCLVFFADVIYLLPNFFLHTYENISIHTFMCVWQKIGRSSLNRIDQWKKHYFTFNTVFFHSIIPSIILLILNWLILYRLSQQRVILAKIGSLDAKNVLKREKQFKEKTIQLVLSSFFVIITISPRYILTMVNAFATSFGKVPLMPLYIYVNLNTVFRVLEMCNYSLNITFSILSGRTSRREIRKLLWECLFWRFKRTSTGHRKSKYPTHSFLLDDDDDIERSMATTHTTASYRTLKTQTSSHYKSMTSKTSCTNYASQQLRRSSTTSVFTCCGISVDLSNKKRHSSNIKCTIDDISAFRSTVPTMKPKEVLLSQTLSCPVSTSTAPTNKIIRQQKTICYRSYNTPNDSCRSINRRRATTVVNCSNRKSSLIIKALDTSNHRSILEETQRLPFERLPFSINQSSIENDELKPNNDMVIETVPIEQTDCEESQLPAYIIATC